MDSERRLVPPRRVGLRSVDLHRRVGRRRVLVGQVHQHAEAAGQQRRSHDTGLLLPRTQATRASFVPASSSDRVAGVASVAERAYDESQSAASRASWSTSG